MLPLVAGTEKKCLDEYIEDQWLFDTQYSDLYLKFEEALLRNRTQLERLRAGFLSDDSLSVFFSVEFLVHNVSSNPTEDRTFCPSHWQLCDDCSPFGLTYEFRPQALSSLEQEEKEQKIDQLITVLSLMHGSLLSLYAPYYNEFSDYGNDYSSQFYLQLKMDNLSFNPTCQLTKCVVSNLLSWIKLYSSGDKPQTWDQRYKGYVTSITNVAYDNDYVVRKAFKFMNWMMDDSQFLFVSIVEFAIVSLCVALVVAKFFPIFHNQMISGANRLEHQSLYWGAAIDGLLLGAMRAGSISLQVIYLIDSNLNLEWFTTYIVTILPIQEGLVFFILLFGAVVGSLKNHMNIPVPSGMAKIVIHISFLFSCLYVCIVCCSPQGRVKALRVLVMLSFMSFVYHAIMDAMSIMFLLFIEGSRASVLTFTLLYVSFVIFLVLIVSFSFLTLFHSRNTNTSFCTQLLSCFGGLCLFFTVFPAVMLMIIMYMIIVFSLNLQGVTGIVTGLIPSIALSAASWYIKKKLEKGPNQPNTDTGDPAYGTISRTVNTERRESEDTSDDERLLQP